jgi:23S rRNA (uracil1939-C5)-methyltransferase
VLGSFSSDTNPLDMQFKKGQIVEFDIHALAFGGSGLGKYEGLTVFVEGTMPGDRVKASFRRIKSKFAEADLIEIVKPSEDRCHEKCKYAVFNEGTPMCRGCQLQFMPYKKQLELKKQQVIDAFERIGKIYDPPVSDVIGCDMEFYYRNKMEFSFGYDKDMNFAVGFHSPGRRYDILDIRECFLQSVFSSEIVNRTREFVLKKGFQPFKCSCGEGFLKSLYIRDGKRTGEVMVNITSSDEIPSGIEKDLNEYVDMLLKIKSDNGEKIVSVYWSKIISKRGVPKRIEETLLYGKKTIREKMILGDYAELFFDILPQAFFQVNTMQAEVLYSQILKLTEDLAQGVVFDLFCGIGTIGLFMAKYFEQVIGVEINEDAVSSARDNAQTNKIFNIDFFTGDVSKVLYTIHERPSLIIVDPPRAGLTKKIIKQINDFGASHLVYVSCNPATLARDCSLLKEYGFTVKHVQPVDMFPHTYHIENVCLLDR